MPISQDGCLLVLDKSLKAKSGYIFVALVYNEFTVKRLVHTSRDWVLHISVNIRELLAPSDPSLEKDAEKIAAYIKTIDNAKKNAKLLVWNDLH